MLNFQDQSITCSPVEKIRENHFLKKTRTTENREGRFFFPLAGTFSSVSGYNFHHVHRFPFSLRESDTGEFLF